MTDTQPRLIHDPTPHLVARLDGMLANLQQHIDERAGELAGPLIAEAQLEADAKVSGAEGMRRRAEDLATELRRQIRSLERRRGEQRERAEQAEAAIARARLLHATPAELVAAHAQSDTLCTTCISPAPCPTRRALDGEDDRG